MCWEPFESPWIRHGFLAPDCCYVERIKVGLWVIVSPDWIYGTNLAEENLTLIFAGPRMDRESGAR